jgi:RhtB (resistance to homoserine/threonine) family protein
MESYLPEFLIFASAHLLSLISPGPDFLMVMQSSLRYSRKTALLVSFGIACGELIHITYSLLGIGLLIAKSMWVFTIIKYLGSAYLIYIGFTTLRAKRLINNSAFVIKDITRIENLSYLQAFVRGFLTNALNAKAAFFTLSFFTVLVSPTTPFYMQALYGAFVSCSTFIWFSLVSTFLTNPHVQKQLLGIKHWIERVCGAVLIFLGIKLAFLAF